MNCEAGSFFNCYNAHRFLQPEVLRLSFPVLEPWVAWSVSLPSCSSWFTCTQVWDPQYASLPHILSSWLSISAPPTSLDECFFFNSFVVRLDFLAFLVVFVFKFVVVLHLVVQGGKVYLPMPPSWLEVISSYTLV